MWRPRRATGPECERLRLLPAKPSNGLQEKGSSSWGGSVLRDSPTGAPPHMSQLRASKDGRAKQDFLARATKAMQQYACDEEHLRITAAVSSQVLCVVSLTLLRRSCVISPQASTTCLFHCWGMAAA